MPLFAEGLFAEGLFPAHLFSESDAVVPPIVSVTPSGGFYGYDRQAHRRRIDEELDKQELADEIRRLEEHLGVPHQPLDDYVDPEAERRTQEIERFRRESALLSNRARRAFDYALRARTEAALALAEREMNRAMEEEELAVLLVLTLD